MTGAAAKAGLGSLLASFVLLGVLATTVAVLGQSEQQSGKIIGTVSGVHGEGLPGASITLSSPQSNATMARVVTDAAGRYVLVNLKYGTYTLGATLMGYKQAETKRFTVSSSTSTVDFSLTRSEEHTSELQSLRHLVCRL